MFVFGVAGLNYDRYNLAIVCSHEGRDELEDTLNSVLLNRPNAFKISGHVFRKTSGNKYEILLDNAKIKISDIDDFFFEELPEAQDFVISLA